MDDLAIITVSLGAGGSGTIDLSGADTNVFNVALAWAKLKSIMVVAAAGNGSTVDIADGANAAIAAFQPLPPGACCFWADPTTGLTVTGGSADILNFTNNDGAAAASVDVYLTGVKS